MSLNPYPLSDFSSDNPEYKRSTILQKGACENNVNKFVFELIYLCEHVSQHEC